MKNESKKNYQRTGKNGSRKNRPDRDYSKKHRETSVDQSRSAVEASSNDIAWYNRYPDLLNSAGQVPFNYYPGMDLRAAGLTHFEADDSSPVQVSFVRKIPGVMAIDFLPTIGRSLLNTDAPSLAAAAMFYRVRKNFSGAIEIDGPDFMMHVLAMDSIFSYLAHLKRLYRAVNVYTPYNLETPIGILRAMGISRNGMYYLQKNKRRLFDNINALIGMISRILVPSDFSLLKRHYWMNDHVYTDTDDKNAQFYIFNQRAYYKFQLDSQGAGMLRLRTVPSFIDSQEDDWIEKLYQYGWEMISAINNREDTFIINGYFMRAYENVPMFSVAPLMENETIEFTYDPMVLEQIHNSRSLPAVFDLESFDITQDVGTNAIIHTPKFWDKDVSYFYGTIVGSGGWLDLSLTAEGQPTPEFITEASRLTALFKSDEDTPGINHVYSGTEVVLDYRFINAFPGSDESYESELITTVMSSDVNSNTQTAEMIERIGYLTAFEHAPIIYSMRYNPEYAQDDQQVYVNCPYHRIAPVPFDTIKRLHEVCLLSQFEAYDYQK